MVYERILEGLRRERHADSVHQASAIAVQFQSVFALLLLTFMVARLASAALAAVTGALTLALLSKRVLTFQVFTENDDRFQTLLHYLILTLAACFIFVRWTM